MVEVDNQRLPDVIERLYAYCKSVGWSGFDPYDGLNSEIVRALRLNRSKFGRTVVIQLFKRSPANLRGLLRIKPGVNPKALALFLSSVVRLENRDQGSYIDSINELTDLLVNMSIAGYSGRCWGYNFDWQSRSFYAPEGTPNAVTTVFAANALLDLYDLNREPKMLEAAASAAEFIKLDLNQTVSKEGFCFSYTPLDNSVTHNVNLLNAALLARIGKYTDDDDLMDTALKAAAFSVSHQRPDGSWPYGENANQNWVDGFHTGYNLVALDEIRRYTDADSFSESFQNGLNFYRQRLFLPGGVAKYYATNVFPIDIHSISQGIITFAKLRHIHHDHMALADELALYAMSNMMDEDGFFYFQKHRTYTNKIPYMRWSQANMLNALTVLETARHE
jgi:hypothetical protein